MFRTVSATAKQCNRLIRSPIINRRGFALVNDYSVRKRMTIGLSGFTVVAAGCIYGGRKIYKNRKAKKMAAAASLVPETTEEVSVSEPVIPVKPEIPIEEPNAVKEVSEEPSVDDAETPVEVSATTETKEEGSAETNEEVPEETVDTAKLEGEEEEEVYNAWWTGVKEISLFLNQKDAKKLDYLFPPTRPYKPQRKVMLSYNPRPEDANEFGPVMGDEVEVKVLAMVSDEHAQVLVVDIGDTESSYRYPHIVLSCDDEDRSAAYSSVYGRLLVDRCVTDGLLVEEGANVYVPKEDVENVPIEGYYSYPETHVTVKDLRSKNIVVKTTLCTGRGMENEKFRCTEGKNDRECAWCVFMKSGPCYKSFDVWQKCILENQEDADSFIANCGEITMALKKCVDYHPEYYGSLSQPEVSNRNFGVEDNDEKEEAPVSEGQEAPVSEEQETSAVEVEETPASEVEETPASEVETPVVESNERE